MSDVGPGGLLITDSRYVKIHKKVDAQQREMEQAQRDALAKFIREEAIKAVPEHFKAEMESLQAIHRDREDRQFIGERAGKAAVNRLVHTVKIVGFIQTVDADAAVVAFASAAPLEHNNAGNCVRTHKVGNVVAFDAVRGSLEPRQLLQLFDTRGFTSAL